MPWLLIRYGAVPEVQAGFRSMLGFWFGGGGVVVVGDAGADDWIIRVRRRRRS